MTQVRKLAVGMAKWVCRHAPAGAREWGAASEAELEHIASDWEALRWALGSTTVLLAGRNRVGPVTSVEQVPALARCMARVVRRRTVLCAVVVVFWAYCCVSFLPRMEGAVLRAGATLVVVAMGGMAVQAYLRRWRGLPKGADNRALIAPLRAELVRQREFHSGGWLAARVYALMPGCLLMCCGIWSMEKTLANAEAAFGLAIVFAVLATIGTRIQLRTADGFQRRIDALDALEAGGVPGAKAPY